MPDYERERQGNGRRESDCKEHESRLDDIGAEVHKHGGWFKVIGAGISIGFTLLLWFGTGINAKLDAIQASLSRTDVSLMEHSQRIKACEEEIREIKERHKAIDTNDLSRRK